MTASVDFSNLLVPVDFSEASEAAFQRALSLTANDRKSVILLHVIDTSLVDFAVEHGWGSTDDVTDRMRELAKQKLAEYQRLAGDTAEIDMIISEGIPFLEILMKAKDFAVDAIVIGRFGARGKIEKLLFGSTAEKVLRGSLYPVIVFPHDHNGA